MPMLTVEKLNDVVNEFDLNANEFSTFVETGTYMGDTVKSVQPYFEVWLDGHFSSGCTSKGEKDVPLLEECKGIDSLYKADEALVLIDDLRLFETDYAEDWSEISIENILNCFTNFEVKQYEHPDDMFCLYIKKKK